MQLTIPLRCKLFINYEFCRLNFRPQSAHRRVNLSPPQKTPPPTPTKPIWYPGMRADPMQFSGRKMQYKTGPPPPAPKVGVASSDILAGPSRLVDKFELNKPAKQEFVPVSLKTSFLQKKYFGRYKKFKDASRLKLFQDLIDHHDNNVKFELSLKMHEICTKMILEF